MGWIAFAEQMPPGGSGKLLVTNNLEARDARGHMSHVWLVDMVHEHPDRPEVFRGLVIANQGEVTAFAHPGDMRLRDLTHWRYALPETISTCTWKETEEPLEDARFWTSECGHDFTLGGDGVDVEGASPVASGFRFCPFCAKPVSEVPAALRTCPVCRGDFYAFEPEQAECDPLGCPARGDGEAPDA